MLPVADGSDFMGSLRNPAGWNDVYGFRPSQGRVPRWPAADVWVALLSTEGPMGRTVQATSPRCSTCRPAGTRACRCRSPTRSRSRRSVDDFDPRGVRIGWLGDLGGHLAMEPGILDLCAGGLARIESAGGSVEPATLGFDPERVWQTLADVAALERRRAHRAASRESRRTAPASSPKRCGNTTRVRTLTGMQTVQAAAERTAFHTRMLALFERYDVLALPSAQVWPFPAEWRWPQSIAGRTMDTYHRWMEVVDLRDASPGCRASRCRSASARRTACRWACS